MVRVVPRIVSRLKTESSNSLPTRKLSTGSDYNIEPDHTASYEFLLYFLTMARYI